MTVPDPGALPSTVAARAIPRGRAAGEVEAPASKSVTNRALLLAAAASGRSTLLGASDSDDTRRLVTALRAAGTGVVEAKPGTVEVAPAVFRDGEEGGTRRIDVGNAGTTLRFLLPFLARSRGEFVVDGLPRMRERPIGGLVTALRALGGDLRFLERDGHLPLAIRGGGLRGGRVRLDASISSQFLTALLLAAPFLPGGLEVGLDGELASASYVRLTGDLLRDFGVALEANGRGFRVVETAVAGRELALERDWSGATYLVAAGILGGGPVSVGGLRRDSSQGDALFADWCRRMGGEVEWSGERLVASSGGPLVAADVDASDAPDAVPTLVALAVFARGTTTVRGAATLRVKESDRIDALVEIARLLGAEAEATGDGLRVVGNPSLAAGSRSPVVIPTRDDHRLAMAAAVAGLARGGVSVENPSCVEKSYPRFWGTFEFLTAQRS